MNLAIEWFCWENTFNSQVKLFIETFMNVFSNFIPKKIKTFAESHSPWINDNIRNKVKLRYKLYH